MIDDILMTPEQVSDYLSVAMQTLANWRSQGEGPRFIHVGGSVRYSRNAVDGWLRARTVNPKEGRPK